MKSLHNRGIGWMFKADGTATSPFWSWINLQVLTDPPARPLSWIPNQYYWWWRASRVLQDYDLNGNRLEVIDEFPFFSYLLGDLHPHVLAMPFNLLAIAVALNIFLGGWQGKIDLFFGELKINKTGFFTIALVLGGLAFLNTWDILPGAALIVFSYALARVRQSGWGWERIEDVLLLGIPAVVTAFLMYLPFFVGFDSQAGGIVPELHVRDARRAPVGDVGNAVPPLAGLSDLSLAQPCTRELAGQYFHRPGIFDPSGRGHVLRRLSWMETQARPGEQCFAVPRPRRRDLHRRQPEAPRDEHRQPAHPAGTAHPGTGIPLPQKGTCEKTIRRIFNRLHLFF